jgi:hypothetical protein
MATEGTEFAESLNTEATEAFIAAVFENSVNPAAR